MSDSGEQAKAPPSSQKGETKTAPHGGVTRGIRDTISQTRADPALLRLGMLLQLERRARQADKSELPFILVNETRQLLPYRQAAYWRVESGRPRLVALSGLSVIDRNAPFSLWINRFAKWRLAGMRKGTAETDPNSPAALAFADLSESVKANPWLAEWKEWLPGHALVLPLFAPGNWLCGLLCLFREEAFGEQDSRLLSFLAESYGQSVGASLMRRRGRRSFFSLRRVVLFLLVALIIAAMFLPRPQTVLAPAEVTARRPAIVRAGIEGVIDSLMVRANQRVAKGEPLLRLEDSQLRTRLAVAVKAEEIAKTEMRQLQQLALSDPKSKGRLLAASGRVQQLASETRYMESLLERVVATSPMDGIALVDNPDDWAGRPVSLGQKIMLVADPGDVELEISLPAAEIIDLMEGDEIQFFPNIAPGSPRKAKITFIGFRAGELPGVGLAFTLRADLEGDDPPMLGLRGTARLHGKTIPLGLIILRRPISAVRQWLGV